MSKQVTCLNCGKRFPQWRKKQYCSDRCRKQAENTRLRQIQSHLPDEEKPSEITQQNQGGDYAVRGDEPSVFWLAVNEVTHKLSAKGGNAVGWAIYIERQKGWFGRVRDEMSFGPTSLNRAREAVEVYLRGEPFEKREYERSWRGNCLEIL